MLFRSVYLQEAQIETMLLAEEEDRLKNNPLTPSNIVASEETSNIDRLADTRGTGQLQIKIRWSSYYLILDGLKPRQKNIQWVLF